MRATATSRCGVCDCTVFQVKLGADGDWQRDIERLIAVRDVVRKGSLVLGDWNCGALPLDAIRDARAVADRDILLEQPCAMLESCAAVKRATGLPMKIDECAYDTASLLRADALGCLDAVALKLSKFGGLSTLRRARELCPGLGIDPDPIVLGKPVRIIA